MSSHDADIATILTFWFTTPDDPAWMTMREAWWEKDPAFDQACRNLADGSCDIAFAGGVGRLARHGYPSSFSMPGMAGRPSS